MILNILFMIYIGVVVANIAFLALVGLKYDYLIPQLGVRVQTILTINWKILVINLVPVFNLLMTINYLTLLYFPLEDTEPFLRDFEGGNQHD